MKKFLLLTAFILFYSVNAFAQWNATLNIVPYPSPYLSNWKNNTSEIGQLIIYSNSNSPETVNIDGIATLDGTGVVFKGTSDNITIQPGIPQPIDISKLIRFGQAKFPRKDLKAKTIQTGRLPEGHYELCVSVLDPLNPQKPLVNNVCADFTIQYPDPPGLIFPDNGSDISNQYVTFQWMPVTVPPDFTIHYSLKIVQILDGQTPQRALEANTVQFERDHLTTTNLTYPISGLPFEAGKTYAWQITALDQNNLPPTQQDGKSEIYTFTYINPDTNNSAVEPSAIASSGSGCSGNTSSSIDHTNIDPSTVTGMDHLTINGFNLYPDHIQENSSDNTYHGTGYINWSPFGSPIKLAVTFSDIKINTDGEVYQGTVTTTITDNSDVSAWTSLSSASTPGGGLSSLGTLSDGQYRSLYSYLSTHLIRSVGNSPVDFPLGFRNESLTNASPLALMGITFTPNSASMNVLYNLDIPDADKRISFFNTCHTVTPDGMGVSSGHSGVLYLPNDVSMTLSDGTFRFKNSSPADTANATYVKWNNDGLQKIVASAEMQISQDHIASIDETSGERVDHPDSVQLNFTFTDWNDWIARATLHHREFEITSLPGFTIKVSGRGYYDHSTNRNPASLTSSSFPDNYTDSPKIGGAFQGLYFPNLNIDLPEGFKTYGSGSDNRISFPFHNFILDEQGVTMHINKNNAFGFNKHGDVGGWPFSIDQFNIIIADDNPGDDMSMTGKLKLPLSNSHAIDYTCNMNTGTADGINYNFDVSGFDGSYPLDVIPATLNLAPNSEISIEKDAEGIAVIATLQGSMSLSISHGSHGSPANITLPGLPFQGMTISNREADGESGLGFDAEAFGANDGSTHDEHNGNNESETNSENGNGTSTTGNNEDNTNTTASNNGTNTTENNDNNATQGGDNGNSNGGEDQGKTAGFKVNLSMLKITPTLQPVEDEANTYRLDINMNIKLNLGFGDSDEGGSGFGITGGTDLDTHGDIHVPGTEEPSINNIGVDLNSINLSGESLGPLTLGGELDFFPNAAHAFSDSTHGDVTFGHGVQGKLHVGIEKLADIKFHAIFGTKYTGSDPLHYWGVGGSVYLESGIQAGPVEFNGLGGGFAYNMAIDTSSVNGNSIDGKGLTHSTSGEANRVELIPQRGHVVISLKAFLSLIRPRIINAIVNANVDVSPSDGLSDVNINGYGAILSMNPPENSHPVGSADINLNYDVADQIFDGSFDGNVQLGIASAHVPIEMHAEPHKYYLYIGVPTPNDARVDFVLLQIPPGIHPPIKPSGPGKPLQAYLEANGYMDMGTQLPSGFPPPLPNEVEQFLAASGKANDKSTTDNAVQSLLSQLRNQSPPSPGFAFGTQINGGINLQLLFLYANVNALAGFDAGLQYVQNPPAACVADGNQFGYNNWYATGQVYAYMDMNVGIHVDVWVYHGNFTLTQMELGAEMQAGLPNPTWMTGDVGIHAQILGGLVKVNDNFPFKVGNACTIPYNPLDNIKLITDAGPKDNAGVFDKPFADFSLPMNKSPMSMTVPPDQNHDSTYTRTFRFFATNFQLYKVKRGGADSLIQGRPSVSSDGKTITLYRNTILQAHKRYKIYIRCKAQEKIGDRWQKPAEGARVQDTTIFFTTGPAPQKLVPRNIVYTYPINRQRYLLKNEFSDKGRIKLGQWQNNILPAQTNGIFGGYNYLLKFIPESSGADTITTHFTLDRSNKSLDFQIPANLKNSTTYKMEVWVKPVHLNPGRIANMINNNIQVHQQVQKNARITNLHKNATGQLVQTQTNKVVKASINYIKAGRPAGNHPLGSEPIYSMRFRTSKFNTFAQKMNALDPLKANPEVRYRHIEIYSNNQSAENFDVFEINGYKSKNTTGYPFMGNQKQIPPLFSASIPYDVNNSTDKYYMNNLYKPAALLGFTNDFQINLGAREVRTNGSVGSAFAATFGAFPRYSLSTDNIAYSPKIPLPTLKLPAEEIAGSSHQVVQIVNAFNLNGRSGNNSFAESQTMGGSGGSASGNNVAVPASYTGLHFHYYGSNITSGGQTHTSGSGSSGTTVQISNSSSPISANVSRSFPSFQLVWKRDEYFHADYQLLKQAYHNLLFVNTPYGHYIVSNSGSNRLATGEYGSVTLSRDIIRRTNLIIPRLNKIKNLQFISTRQLSTNRAIHFQYRYPCLDCSVPPVTVTKHLNELRISRNAQHQMQQAQQSQQLNTGSSSAPLILHFN